MPLSEAGPVADPGVGDRWFATTHWSTILSAKEAGSTEAAASLEALCRTYWPALYAYIRREGHDPHDAQDLTQAFFAHLLQRDFLENVRPHKGKFRSFLLAALKHFLCDQWDKARAAKRGGGQTLLSLDACDAEELYQLQAHTEQAPDHVFQQRWALTVLANALARLKDEFVAAGKADEFEQLKTFLSTPTRDGDYDAVAAARGTAVDLIRVKVHRLRQRYGQLIREEIAQTVASPADLEEELQQLFDAVGR